MKVDLKSNGRGAIAVFSIATIAACLFSAAAMVGPSIFTTIAIALVGVAAVAFIAGIGFLIAAEMSQNYQG